MKTTRAAFARLGSAFRRLGRAIKDNTRTNWDTRWGKIGWETI